MKIIFITGLDNSGKTTFTLLYQSQIFKETLIYTSNFNTYYKYNKSFFKNTNNVSKKISEFKIELYKYYYNYKKPIFIYNDIFELEDLSQFDNKLIIFDISFASFQKDKANNFFNKLFSRNNNLYIIFVSTIDILFISLPEQIKNYINKVYYISYKINRNLEYENIINITISKYFGSNCKREILY